MRPMSRSNSHPNFALKLSPTNFDELAEGFKAGRIHYLTDTYSFTEQGVLVAELADKLGEALEKFQKVTGRLNKDNFELIRA